MKNALRKIICICLVSVTAFLLSPTNAVFAHPGRLDSKGGHNVRADGWGYPVGSYHYHRGSDRDTAYDANGNVITKTGEASSSKSTPAPTPAPTASPTPVPTPAPSAAIDEISVFVNGERVTFADQQPIILSDWVMVPVRSVVEKMGCSVSWDDENQTAYINEPDSPRGTESFPKSDGINIYVNNTQQVIFEDQPPVLLNGQVLIPIRNVVEKLGYSVEWDNDARSVHIDNANQG